MALEIERKFLVRNDDWRRAADGIRYRQGYLLADPKRNVRIRSGAGKGFVTIKGETVNRARPEYEYPIPVEDADALLDTLCLKPIIEKTRYVIDYAGLRWEVDEFEGENAGLIIAEVELTTVDQPVELPHWIGQEVTDDPRYYNASLIRHPFTTWTRKAADLKSDQ